MSDQEMIKRVATAIHARTLESDQLADFGLPFEDAETCAIAALEALKEPTQSMVDAALHHYMACEKEKRLWNGREMYKVMINHILAD